MVTRARPSMVLLPLLLGCAVQVSGGDEEVVDFEGPASKADGQNVRYQSSFRQTGVASWEHTIRMYEPGAVDGDRRTLAMFVLTWTDANASAAADPGDVVVLAFSYPETAVARFQVLEDGTLGAPDANLPQGLAAILQRVQADFATRLRQWFANNVADRDKWCFQTAPRSYVVGTAGSCLALGALLWETVVGAPVGCLLGAGAYTLYWLTSPDPYQCPAIDPGSDWISIQPYGA